jgi:hypothetical protein
MKMRALTTLFALLFVSSLWCQSNNWSERVHALRPDFLELTPEHKTLLNRIYLSADSLASSNTASYKAELDSLSSDSLTNTLHHVGVALENELFAYYCAIGAVNEADARMLSLQARLMKIGNQDELTMSLHLLISEYFASRGNWASAYSSGQAHLSVQLALHSLELGAMEAKIAESEVTLAQTSKSLAQTEASLKRYEQAIPWAAGITGLLVVLLVLFVIRSIKLKNRFTELRKRFEDQHISVDETQKLSVQYKNEGEQFKQTVEAAITKLNDIEAAKVLAYKELNLWKEESSEDLVQLKEIVDTLKEAPSVSMYMQIQNHVARLQNKNKEKLQALSDLLKK